MGYSADTSRLAFTKEATQGTTPTDAQFFNARVGSESIGLDVNTTESVELNPNRGVTDAVLAGATSSGGMEGELVYSDLWDLLFSSVHGTAWATDNLDVGNIIETYSVEKTFDDGATPYEQLYQGVSISSYNVSISPNSPIGLTWTTVGGTMLDPIGGAPGTPTYDGETVTLTQAPVMTAHRSTTTWGGGANGLCITALDLTVDSQNRGIQCISDLGDKEVALGKLKVTGTASVYFASNAIMQEFLDASEQAVTIACRDRDTATIPLPRHTYTWTLPRVKWTAGATNITGTGEDIINEMEFEALVDSGAGYSVRLSRLTETA